MKFEKVYHNLHLLETQKKILDENKHKSGIYMIFNNINKKKYIGSASTNRINIRFRNHLIHFTGSKLVAAAVAKYGIENFSFYIIEYYPGFVKKENLSPSHIQLLELETNYISLYSPEYNILTQAESTMGYRHTEETKEKLKKNYSQERKDRIGNINKGKIFTKERRELFSKIAKLRNSNQELRKHLSKLFSKPVILYDQNGNIHSKYSSIRTMAKAFNCCHKTINKALKENTIFRNIGKIRLEKEVNQKN